MLKRRHILAGLGAAATPALAQDPPAPTPGRRAWTGTIPAIRVAVTGGETLLGRAEQVAPYARLLESVVGVPASVRTIDDRDRLVDALVDRELDLAWCSPMAFAVARQRSHQEIVPLVALDSPDGGGFYRSVMVVRADSPVRSLADLRGRSIAWSGPTSAGGYLLPRAAFIAMGVDPRAGAFFSRTTFAHGHDQGVKGVLRGDWDAGLSWTAGDGDATKGGALRRLADAGAIDPRQLRIIWQSPPLPTGPIVAYADTPQGFRDDISAFHLALGQAHPGVLAALEGIARPRGSRFVPVGVQDYAVFTALLSAPG